MEPSISLQSHIFNSLEREVYRDINVYNPLNITHPPQTDFLDPVSRSATGDNLTSSIDIIIPQDCDGFNLGSFFVRRSPFTDRLLDMWWDPCFMNKNICNGNTRNRMLWSISTPHSLTYALASHSFLSEKSTRFLPEPAVGNLLPIRKVKTANRFWTLDFTIMRKNEISWSTGWLRMGPRLLGRDVHVPELSNRFNRSWWEHVKADITQRWTNFNKAPEKTKAG